MNPFEYEYLRKLLKDRSGLVLSSDKQYLLESRLLPIVRQLDLRLHRRPRRQAARTGG